MVTACSGSALLGRSSNAFGWPAKLIPLYTPQIMRDAHRARERVYGLPRWPQTEYLFSRYRTNILFSGQVVRVTIMTDNLQESISNKSGYSEPAGSCTISGE